MGAMVSALIGGAAFDEVVAPTFWHSGQLHPAVAELSGGSWKGKERPSIRGTGYCVDALWSVGGAADFQDAVLRAANLGDDADTTAAIAGQLAGARWGASDISKGWRGEIVAKQRIVSLASGLFVAGGGEIASTAWSYDEFVHAWWVESSRLLAGEYPGHTCLPVRARRWTSWSTLASGRW
jgi:hypothetical protein